MTLEIIAALITGYVCGSLPFGLIITRLAGLGDIRAIGSGNIGATNVLRTGHKGLAALTLIGDMAKGFIPVLLFNELYGLVPHGLAAGFAALIGHMFPIWLKFKGGKGVATYIGAVTGFSPALGLVFVGIWLMAAFLFRYSSLSALIAVLLVPLIALYLAGDVVAICLSLMSILVIIRHRANIERLIAGGEDKIGSSQSD